ncbi:MAG: serine/threonine protein kinase [Proteobacteria bacterium]|nr:serine/threonine protein kinase [Pseudomonadota bacterium]
MISSNDHVRPGERIGDYSIKEQIAIGGFGTVWRAIHVESERVAAIKVLHAHLVSSEILVLRLEREARAIALMRHPNIVDLYDHGRLPDGRPYLVMEYLTGQDLGTHIALRGTLSPEKVMPILDQLGSALTAAHAHGIVHRDLKASNVFLSGTDRELRVVLFDFGIAKLLGNQGPKLTLSSSLLGSPACISPEQILGQAVDARTDVYALGSLTYQMLVGHPPFSGASPTSILTMHLEEYPPHPSHYGDVLPIFDSVVMKAMSKEPDARYQSVADFVAAFWAAKNESESAPSKSAGLDAATLALGLFVDVQAEADALDEPDDALLDDLESLVPEAARVLEARGFLLAYERGNSALFVTSLPSDPAAEAALREQEVNTALSLLDVMRVRPTCDPRVRVNLYLHVDEAVIQGQQVKSGRLLDCSSWTPAVAGDHVVAGGAVFASGDVLRGLGLKSQLLSPSSPIHRVEDPLSEL